MNSCFRNRNSEFLEQRINKVISGWLKTVETTFKPSIVINQVIELTFLFCYSYSYSLTEIFSKMCRHLKYCCWKLQSSRGFKSMINYLFINYSKLGWKLLNKHFLSYYFFGSSALVSLFCELAGDMEENFLDWSSWFAQLCRGLLSLNAFLAAKAATISCNVRSFVR